VFEKLVKLNNSLDKQQKSPFSRTLWSKSARGAGVKIL
jgi:hypothetical protein